MLQCWLSASFFYIMSQIATTKVSGFYTMNENDLVWSLLLAPFYSAPRPQSKHFTFHNKPDLGHLQSAVHFATRARQNTYHRLYKRDPVISTYVIICNDGIACWITSANRLPLRSTSFIHCNTLENLILYVVVELTTSKLRSHQCWTPTFLVI